MQRWLIILVINALAIVASIASYSQVVSHTIKWEASLLRPMAEDKCNRVRKEFSLSYSIDTQRYLYEINQPLEIDSPNLNGVIRAFRRVDTDLRDQLLSKLADLTQGMADQEKVEVVLNFAAFFPYHQSPSIYQLPIQTLYEKQGDCLDKTLLAYWLLSGTRFANDIGLASFPEIPHAAVAIRIEPAYGAYMAWDGFRLFISDVAIQEATSIGDLSDQIKSGELVLGAYGQPIKLDINRTYCESK